MADRSRPPAIHPVLLGPRMFPERLSQFVRDSPSGNTGSSRCDTDFADLFSYAVSAHLQEDKTGGALDANRISLPPYR